MAYASNFMEPTAVAVAAMKLQLQLQLQHAAVFAALISFFEQ